MRLTPGSWRAWTVASAVMATTLTTVIVLTMLHPLFSLTWCRDRRRKLRESEGSGDENSQEKQQTLVDVETDGPLSSSSRSSSSVRVAFLGNSILYFNDCPRLLQQMLETRHSHVEQDSCLRPSANLSRLWKDGNGMHKRFRTLAALRDDGVSYDFGASTVQELLLRNIVANSDSWDFIVLNDHTRAPVHHETKNATKEILSKHYVELFGSSKVILLQTAAYREPKIHDSEDLGSFEEFSTRLQTGYNEYALFLKKLGVECQVAPFGQAVRHLHSHNPDLWRKTYSSDSFHPSPHGTWMMACVLFCTLLRQPPPPYNPGWWKSSRFFESPPMPLPTHGEGQELRRVACFVCEVTAPEGTVDHSANYGAERLPVI